MVTVSPQYSKQTNAISAVQKQKIKELYHALHPGITPEAVTDGVDQLFVKLCKRPMLAATYEEGAQITAQLLSEQRATHDVPLVMPPLTPQPEPPATPAPVAPVIAPPAPAIELTEAPFSWNVTAEAEDGWNEMFTVRALDSGEFIKRVEGVKKYLASKGYKPASRGKPQAAPVVNAPAMNGEEAPVCPYHKEPMTKRQGKNGMFWSCHHKIEGTDQWCQYKPPSK